MLSLVAPTSLCLLIVCAIVVVAHLLIVTHPWKFVVCFFLLLRCYYYFLVVVVAAVFLSALQPRPKRHVREQVWPSLAFNPSGEGSGIHKGSQWRQHHVSELRAAFFRCWPACLSVCLRSAHMAGVGVCARERANHLYLSDLCGLLS